MATAQISKQSESFTIAPITFEVQKEQIEQLAAEYLPLAILDVNDKSEVEAVHAARMVCVKARTGIDKKRKLFNEESNERIRRVNSAAKTLIDLLAPIEAHLTNEEGKVEREKDRVRQEAEKQRQATLKAKVEAFSAVGVTVTTYDVEHMSEKECESSYLDAKAAFAEKREREAAEAEERVRVAEENRIAAEALATERAELEKQKADRDKAAAEERAILDKQRQEQAAAQAKIDAENKRLADEAAAKERAEELERVKAEAAEKARLEAIAEQERKAAAEKAQAEAEAEEVKRIEAMRPDRAKFLAVADQINTVVVPNGKSPQANAVAESIREVRNRAVNEIRELANSLGKRKAKRAG